MVRREKRSVLQFAGPTAKGWAAHSDGLLGRCAIQCYSTVMSIHTGTLPRYGCLGTVHTALCTV